MSSQHIFDSPERKPQKEQKSLLKVLMRVIFQHKQRMFKTLREAIALGDSNYKKSFAMGNDRSIGMDMSRNIKDLAGVSGIYNYSMMYKNDGRSVHFDLNESSNILDTSHFAFLRDENNENNDNDEPTMRRKKSAKEVNKSTYLTYDAQISRQFKAR